MMAAMIVPGEVGLDYADIKSAFIRTLNKSISLRLDIGKNYLEQARSGMEGMRVRGSIICSCFMPTTFSIKDFSDIAEVICQACSEESEVFFSVVPSSSLDKDTVELVVVYN